MKPVTYRVARSQDAVYVRVNGMGTMVNSPTFKDFTDRMAREGFKAVVVDLAECKGVDSTFMGLLVGMRETLVVVNVTAHCRKQMECVGLHRLLRIQDGVTALPSGLELKDLPDTDVDATTRMKLIQRAHQDLVALDRSNEAKFGAFLKDIAKRLGEKAG